MNIKRVLSQGAFWQINKHLAIHLGSIDAALLLSEFIDKHSFYELKGELIERDGLEWFYATSEKIQESTTLSYRAQKASIKILEKSGLICSKRMGTPAKLYFTICEDKIWQCVNPSFNDPLNQELADRQNIINNRSINNRSSNNRTIKAEQAELEIWPTFDDFWEIVIHKTGKAEAREYWNGKKKLKGGIRLNQKMKEIAMEHYQQYSQSNDPNYITRPHHYLYRRVFEDEIIDRNKQSFSKAPTDTGRSAITDFI